jgi:hypothetical protein
MQFSRLILTNESVYKSPNSYLTPYYIAPSSTPLLSFLQTFFLKLSLKAASRLTVALCKDQDSVPYVAIGLVNVLQLSIFSTLVLSHRTKTISASAFLSRHPHQSALEVLS